MASTNDALEERLLQYLLEQETKKKWEEWLQWLADLDCPLSFDKPLHIPNRPFSFQTWLTACEQQLSQHPDWQARLSTPAWLKRQQVTVMPKILKSGENQIPGIAEIGALNSELARLIDQIHTVQQRITHLETGTSQRTITPAGQSASKQIPAVTVPSVTLPVSGLSDPLGRPDLARTLERELQMLNKGGNTKASPNSKGGIDSPEPEIVSLKEAYLSFNRWCDQFDEVHLDLQEFVNGTLRVPSSHQISFQQFSHRVLKNAKELKELEHVMESFSRLRSGGVDIKMEESLSTAEISESATDL
ncbi:MAG: hypothetical protein MK515_00795 [SAR324 cluster bacterium]|jgi:hypothetical protein|nr:hypothetical protein [SAR324 cluster bacterium]MCH2264987.1 hypothetical protein [SAR324 cluster bacterium]